MKSIDTEEYEETIVKGGQPSLILFTRDMCRICDKVRQDLEALSENSYYKGKFGFYEVNLEEQTALFRSFDLKSIPQVLFFNDGEMVKRMPGDHTASDFVEEIETLLGESIPTEEEILEEIAREEELGE